MKPELITYLLPDAPYSAELSVDIAKAYNKLVDASYDASDVLRNKKGIESTGGLVSITDLIAYQIGWGSLLLSWYEAGLAGKTPQMPSEEFPSWDYIGIAKHFYKKYHLDGGSEQYQALHDVAGRIIAMVEVEAGKGNLEQKRVWPWCTLKSGKDWPLSKWVTVNTISPYNKATALIKKFLSDQA